MPDREIGSNKPIPPDEERPPEVSTPLPPGLGETEYSGVLERQAVERDASRQAEQQRQETEVTRRDTETERARAQAIIKDEVLGEAFVPPLGSQVAERDAQNRPTVYQRGETRFYTPYSDMWQKGYRTDQEYRQVQRVELQDNSVEFVGGEASDSGKPAPHPSAQNITKKELEQAERLIPGFASMSKKEQFNALVDGGLIDQGSRFAGGEGKNWSYYPAIEFERTEALRKREPLEKHLETRRAEQEQAQKDFEGKTIKLKDGQHVLISDFNELDEKYRTIGLREGFKALNEAIGQDNKNALAEDSRRDSLLAELENKGYRIEGDSYNIAQFLKDNPTREKELTIAFTEASIANAKNSATKTFNVLEDIPKKKGATLWLDYGKGIYRSLTPWREEKGESFIAFIKASPKRLISKETESQSQLKAEYEAFQKKPLWSKILNGQGVVKEGGRYFRVVATEAPAVGGASRVAKQTVTTIPINWNKILEQRLADQAKQWVIRSSDVPLPKLIRDVLASRPSIVEGAKGTQVISKTQDLERAASMSAKEYYQAERAAQAAKDLENLKKLEAMKQADNLSRELVKKDREYAALIEQLAQKSLGRIAPFGRVGEGLKQREKISGYEIVGIPIVGSMVLAKPRTAVKSINQVRPATFVRSDTKTEARTKSLSDTKGETKTISETMTKVDTKAQTISKTEAKPATKTATEIKTELETSPATETQTKTSTATQTQQTVGQRVNIPTSQKPMSPNQRPPPRKPPRRPLKPPFPILKIKKKTKHLTPEQIKSAIAWRQGALTTKGKKQPVTIARIAPYGPKDKVVFIGKTPEGMEVAPNQYGAYRSIQLIKGKSSPAKVVTKVGFQTVTIRKPRQKAGNGRSIMRFVPNIGRLKSKRVGRQFVTQVGRGKILSRSPL